MTYPSTLLYPAVDLFPGDTAPVLAPGPFPGADLFPGYNLFPGAVAPEPTPSQPPPVGVPFLASPIQPISYPLAGRGLIGSYDQALTVYRVDGQWRTRFSPSFDELAAADRVYAGGYVHQLGDQEVADLVAAGFGDNIIYQEVT